MTDIRELYQEVILDHSRHPRNFNKIENADHQAQGYNPLCGDQVTLYLKMNKDVIENVSFEGSGCAISTASISMLTECIKGKTIKETELLFKKFHTLLTGDGTTTEGPPELGKLEVFKGVQEFPMRVKCATLCWHTLMAALEDKEIATTE